MSVHSRSSCDFLNTKNDVSQLTLTFDELEGILENKLPQSAFVYDVWWRKDKTHSQAKMGEQGMENYQTKSTL
ncbi:DUF7662 domain-containing protein [Bacillus sp. UNC438CL73TsuS30]|uniref:DUF7662 domain-containing protein n=1 Tax=Bacillus sp. UNC438CL73TsuS30 TaxID=1340434 RepID=UPI003FA48059